MSLKNPVTPPRIDPGTDLATTLPKAPIKKSVLLNKCKMYKAYVKKQMTEDKVIK